MTIMKKMLFAGAGIAALAAADFVGGAIRLRLPAHLRVMRSLMATPSLVIDLMATASLTAIAPMR